MVAGSVSRFCALACALGTLFMLGHAPETAAAQENLRPTSKVQTPIRMALTFDDLPGSPIPEYGSARILADIVQTLRAHGVRSATGFVIGERLVSDPEAQRALAAWTSAGFEVGNHSWSHRSLDEVGTDAYVADLVRLDAPLRTLERESGQRARYFRYPFLEEGRSDAERRTLARTLASLGYALARVSLDFSDWGWADPYARCLAQRDGEALALLSKSYLAFASAGLAWSHAAAQKVLRRPLVHVLLLHANVATAHNLDALLTEYERAGVQFVPLAEALEDPAYTAEYDASISHVLTLSSLGSQRALPPHQVRPLELLELACR